MNTSESEIREMENIKDISCDILFLNKVDLQGTLIEIRLTLF